MNLRGVLGGLGMIAVASALCYLGWPARQTTLLSGFERQRAAPRGPFTNARHHATSVPSASRPPEALARPAAAWSRMMPEAACARFRDWAERYAAALTPDAKAALEPEGVAHARARRAELAMIIPADPERALQLAVPLAARRGLPQTVLSLLEERISGRGMLALMAAWAAPGKERVVQPNFHTAIIAGREYAAFVYGRRLGQPTRFNVPLHGIAVPDETTRTTLLAVDENPARLLDPAELSERNALVREAVCAVSGRAAAIPENAQVLDIGGDEVVVCEPRHAEEYNERLIAAEEGQGPGGTEGSAAIGATSYTEGQKRLLLIRVDFPDLTGEPFGESAGLGLITNLYRYFADASYGKMGILLPGQGSNLTPTLRMPQPAAYYGTNNLYSLLRSDARTAADTAGFSRGDYDFDVICLGSVPGFHWTGLAFVGVPGAWLRNTSASGTAAHELGHNLGLNHAGFWDTGGQSVIGAGTLVEYGDNFDTMGSGGSSRPFNARSRAYLNWLTPADWTTFTTNGIYRIMAFDQTNSSGLRAVRIVRKNGNAATNHFWLEFRQSSSANTWQRNGAGLRWAGSGNQKTCLLDATPGSSGGKEDAAIAIGRTFSDQVFDIHITPLARFSAAPASLDIMIQSGAASANRPPTIVVTADITAAPVNTRFSFTALASDPDGDALAYFWDFGNGDTGPNASATSNSWANAGEYLVQCTVSDMKGGTASDSIILGVGAPSTYRITGRVIAQEAPLAGVRISSGNGLVTYTDSDGTYALVGLSAGPYTVNARSERYTFSHPAFANPVRLGPSADNIDFVAGSSAAEGLVSLVTSGAEWRYLDNGSNPGTNWLALDFDDQFWESGRSQLGYGDDDEATLVRFGDEPDNKPITTYFRHRFVVLDSTEWAALTLGLLRDDGAVAYLNGREVFRSNMPPGPINATSRASVPVSGSEESAFLETDLDPTHLLTGTNLLAVEVHQNDPASTDLSFDLSLTALSLTGLPRGAYLVSPAHNATFAPGADIVLGAQASAGGTQSIAKVEFFANNMKLGECAHRPYRLVWRDAPLGTCTAYASAVDGAGLILTSTPVTIHVNVLAPRGSIWKYLDNGAYPGPTWMHPGYDDSGWPAGPARLGYGGDGEITTVGFGPSADSKHLVYYFRRWFDIPPDALLTNMLCRLQRDDGAVVYLNGVEVFRSNLPPGPLQPTTPASLATEGADEQTFFETSLAMDALVPGRNLIAVQLHQRSGSSPDLGFDLEIAGEGACVPRLRWERLSPALLRLSWTASSPGWKLYSSPGPIQTNAVWTEVTPPPETTNGQSVLLFAPAASSRFYQLRNQ